MTITRINDKTIMLELLTEEVPKGSEEDLLYHILSIAVSAEHLNAENCAFLLEGVESKKGFVFLITIKNSRRRFKIKKNLTSAIYIFENLEDLLSCICALYKGPVTSQSSSTYLMDDKYYLSFSHTYLPKGAKVLLSEYGTKCKNPTIVQSVLSEHGHLLTQGNSIALIGESFRKH
ncbi:MAG: adaptor protein MecA [Ruminococcus sp.]